MDGPACKHKQKGKVQWEACKTLFIHSTSHSEPQPEAKQNVSDDRGENI